MQFAMIVHVRDNFCQKNIYNSTKYVIIHIIAIPQLKIKRHNDSFEQNERKEIIDCPIELLERDKNT